jgi:hypothetical protein
MAQNYNILCCDGGGIRGLLTATILASLPTAISNASVFAGTSTGGILSIGMAAGVDITTLLGMYQKDCSRIFASSPASTDDEIFDYLELAFGDIKAAALWAVIELDSDLKMLFTAKWSNSSLKSLLSSTLPDPDKTFAELATKLFVTTFQLDNGGYKNQWRPISIDNLGQVASDSTLIDAAMSTSAAPTYFPPYNHPTFGYCVDGGTFANDPSTYVVSRVLHNNLAPSLDSIRVLSIGTGKTMDGIPQEYFGQVAPELWGTYQYMFPAARPSNTPSQTLISLLMDGSSDSAAYETGELLPDGHSMRVQIDMDEPVTLDACSEVGKLERMAEKFMKTNEWTRVQEWVAKNFV